MRLIESVSTAPRCTALCNLLKYLWFPYKIKVIRNNLVWCVIYLSLYILESFLHVRLGDIQRFISLCWWMNLDWSVVFDWPSCIFILSLWQAKQIFPCSNVMVRLCNCVNLILIITIIVGTVFKWLRRRSSSLIELLVQPLSALDGRIGEQTGERCWHGIVKENHDTAASSFFKLYAGRPQSSSHWTSKLMSLWNSVFSVLTPLSSTALQFVRSLCPNTPDSHEVIRHLYSLMTSGSFTSGCYSCVGAGRRLEHSGQRLSEEWEHCSRGWINYKHPV